MIVTSRPAVAGTDSLCDQLRKGRSSLFFKLDRYISPEEVVYMKSH